MNSTMGYVYVLINPSLNGIVKIGKTQNSPEERAKELSSATGVPTPFFVAYSSYFKDCSAVEIFVHTRLESNRVAGNREFFRVSVQKAIEIVREAEATFGMISESTTDKNLMTTELSTKPLAPWKVVFRSANAHFYGMGDTIQDQGEALQLYTKAAKLGSISAYWKIGMIYLTGIDQDLAKVTNQLVNRSFRNAHIAQVKNYKQRFQMAKTAFLDGIRVGNDLCWAGLAEINYRENHIENWDKCWKKYFSSSFFGEGKKFEEYDGDDVIFSRKEHQMCVYVSHSASKNWKMSQQDLILEKREEMLPFILWCRMKSGNQNMFKLAYDTMVNLIQKTGINKQKPVSLTPPISDGELKNKNSLELFQMANALYYDASEDNSKKAIYLYEKAALSGFKLAYWKVGRIYSSGYEVAADKEKAANFLSKGAELGVDLCWTELAYLFSENKNMAKWNACWKRYFESKTFLNNVVYNELVGFDKFKSSREYQMFFYVQQASGNKWKAPYMPTVIKFRGQISEVILKNADSIRIGDIPFEEILEILKVTEPGNTKGAVDYCREILATIPLR